MPDEGDDAKICEAIDRDNRRLAVRSVAWCLIYLLCACGSALLL
jgi:hypothetical protein